MNQLRSDLKYLLYLVGLIVVIILGLVFPQFIVPVPAFWPFGMGFIAVLFIADISIEVWRGKSPHVISNVGHYSINSTKDIHRIPWHNDYVTVKDEHNITLGNITIMFPGGIDYWGISMKSSAEYPVFIFPSYCEESEGTCTHVLANLQPYKITQLSPYIQYVLSRFKRRINKRTPIYYGITSHMNATAIPTNIKIELKEKKDNELISSFENINNKLYDQLDKQEKRKIKNIFVREKGNIEED